MLHRTMKNHQELSRNCHHMNTAAKHHIDCEWQYEQYDWECTCGTTRAMAQSTGTPAQELRELARDIYAMAGTRCIASVAMPAVNALCEYLALRARVMELEAEREACENEALRLHANEVRRAYREERNMTQAAKSAVRELKATIEKLNVAQSNPQQLQQLVQEIQQKVQKLESEMDEDR